jgi:hypothetical protein
MCWRLTARCTCSCARHEHGPCCRGPAVPVHTAQASGTVLICCICWALAALSRCVADMLGVRRTDAWRTARLASLFAQQQGALLSWFASLSARHRGGVRPVMQRGAQLAARCMRSYARHEQATAVRQSFCCYRCDCGCLWVSCKKQAYVWRRTWMILASRWPDSVAVALHS